MMRWGTEVVVRVPFILRTVLAFVFQMGWALHIDKQCDFLFAQPTLLIGQNQIILVEDHVVAGELLALFAHLVQDLVLLLDQEGPLNLLFTLLLVLWAGNVLRSQG